MVPYYVSGLAWEQLLSVTTTGAGSTKVGDCTVSAASPSCRGTYFSGRTTIVYDISLSGDTLNVATDADGSAIDYFQSSIYAGRYFGTWSISINSMVAKPVGWSTTEYMQASQ